MQGVAMTKSQLILRLAEQNPHLFHRDIERIVATVFDEVSAALARGERVELRGFGAFQIVHYREIACALSLILAVYCHHIRGRICFDLRWL